MSSNGNVFDNSLFNFGPADDLFKADDNGGGGGGLFDTPSGANEEKPKDENPKEEAAENTDLFGEPIEEETEEKAAPAPATPTKAAPVKAEDKKEDDSKADDKKDPAKNAPKPGGKKKDLSKVKIGPTWNIAYAARQMNPPEVDMTLEQVRQWLELDYPELSKERTKWDVDEKKMLAVPIVSGAKMG